MDSKRVKAIIIEEINKMINEEFIDEFVISPKHTHNHIDVEDPIQKLIHTKHYQKDEDPIQKLIHKKHHKEKDDDEDKTPKKKLRKRAGGGEIAYDYDEYEKKNRKISIGDADSIRSTIDTEKTNMAAVARELFPDHTDEGAQSQLRKIINGERPMTKSLASKIEKMISIGQIAVK